VPNGTYRVRVVAGDPTRIDSVYRTKVEGVLAIDAVPDAANLWFENTVVVAVTDGRLRIESAAGAVNNRLNFVEIERIAPAGLIGAYDFDEATGTTTADGSTSGNDGTLTGGASFVAGHSGTGVAFDGLTGRVALSADLSADLGGDSTVAFWINTTQAGNDDVFLAPGVIGIDAAGIENDIFWGWLTSAGHIGVQAGDTPGAASATPINDGQWHFVAMTRNADSGRVKVYVDGELSGSALSAPGQRTAPVANIGRIDDAGGAPTHFDGTLDQLRLFSRVLTADQILALI
jgi:hypothetical protein